MKWQFLSVVNAFNVVLNLIGNTYLCQLRFINRPNNITKIIIVVDIGYQMVN